MGSLSEQFWQQADQSGRLEYRVDCPECSKRRGDMTVALNTVKRCGVCHRCGWKPHRDKPLHERPPIPPPEYDKAQRYARELMAQTVGLVEHDYLKKKQIEPHGLRLLPVEAVRLPQRVKDKGDLLFVPLKDVQGTLWGCELIASDGSKASGFGSRRPGVFFPLKGGKNIWICEGVATAISLHMDTGDSVAACAGASHIAHAVQALKGAFSDRQVTIMADDDSAGLAAARQVSSLYGVKVCKPDFDGLERGKSDTDYNDLMRLKNEQ